MHIQNPVILRPNKRRHRRGGNPPHRRFARHSQHAKVIEHSLIVMPLFRDMPRAVRRHTRRHWIAPRRAFDAASAVSSSGTVVRPTQ